MVKGKSRLRDLLLQKPESYLLLLQALVKSSASIFSTAMDHPFLSFFGIVCSWVGFAYLLKKMFSSSPSIHAGNPGKSEDYVKKD